MSLQIKASVMFGQDDRVSLDSADQHGLVFSIAEARGAGVREILIVSLDYGCVTICPGAADTD